MGTLISFPPHNEWRWMIMSTPYLSSVEDALVTLRTNEGLFKERASVMKRSSASLPMMSVGFSFLFFISISTSQVKGKCTLQSDCTLVNILGAHAKAGEATYGAPHLVLRHTGLARAQVLSMVNLSRIHEPTHRDPYRLPYRECRLPQGIPTRRQ